MKSAKLPIIFLVLILVVLPLGFSLLFKRVPPDTIGIKQVRWGGGGFVTQDYEPGFHFGVSGYHKWHFLPRRTHFLHFTSESPRHDGVVTWGDPREIRTTDNNLVDIEVTIPYRIIEGKGHGILVDGIKADYQEQVRLSVEGVLKEELSKLTSEDLQNTELRIKRAKETLPVLNERLAQFHIVADNLLIRRFGFPAEYEDKLQEKQYLRQAAKLDQAMTAQANEQKTINLIEKQIVAAELASSQDWEKKLQEKRSEYEVLLADIKGQAEVYSARTRAEGSAQREILEAEGKLAMEQSEALRNKLRTEALNSDGGRILLALEAAHNLNVPEVTLNSDDPAVPMLLDLHALTRMLVGGELVQAAAGADG